MTKLIAASASLCVFAGLAGCDQTTSNAVGGLLDAGATIACADLSKGNAALFTQCSDAAGSLIPVGRAVASGLIRK
jgi:hypothetical protein